MNIKTRLIKLEQLMAKNGLLTCDLTELTDEELDELQNQLQEQSATLFGRENAEVFSNWIATLPEEELEKLSNNKNYLISEMQG